MSVTATSSDLVAERIGRVLSARYGVLRAGAKRLAASVGADPRAVKNWLAGTNAPQLSHAIDLMAADPAIEAEILALVRGRREQLCAVNSSWDSAGTGSAGDGLTASCRSCASD
ncbi:hypothetical protein [Teichococcus aestuarii]|uniref:hypothetical protein n=1 Tax=Teichococcus aestuarii TaxID=568898 RepID=UPI00361573B4